MGGGSYCQCRQRQVQCHHGAALRAIVGRNRTAQLAHHIDHQEQVETDAQAALA